MTVIAGSGTAESTWRPWLARTTWPEDTTGSTGRRPPERVPGPRPRVVVLAAHPDDEVLGAGGHLHLLARAGWQVDVVWASDGEASHPGSTVLGASELARRRRAESLAARAALGLTGRTSWLGLPDSGLQAHEEAVVRALDRAVAPAGTDSVPDPVADLLVAPWHGDGHPDHEVCGRAALRVGGRRGVPVHEVPIWAWHWGTPRTVAPLWTHAATVTLDARAVAAKAAAVQRFVTQVRPLGPAPADRAVLPENVLVRFARPVEVVLRTPGTRP